MQDIYPISEAQAKLSRLCKRGRRFIIANRNRPVMVAMPVEEFEAILETMDVLANPDAMREIERAKTGKAVTKVLDLNNENFGL